MSYIIQQKFRGKTLTGIDNLASLEIKDVSKKDRSFVAIASSESPDRAGDIIVQRGIKWQEFRRNPVVMPSHNYQSEPVGTSLREWLGTHDGKKVTYFEPKFASTTHGDTLYQLYLEKVMRAFSIGFLSLRDEPLEEEGEEKDIFSMGPRRFLEVEALEVSTCAIGMNRDALAMVKNLSDRNMIPRIPDSYLEINDDDYIELKDADDDEDIDKMIDEAIRKNLRYALGRLED